MPHIVDPDECYWSINLWNYWCRYCKLTRSSWICYSYTVLCLEFCRGALKSYKHSHLQSVRHACGAHNYFHNNALSTSSEASITGTPFVQSLVSHLHQNHTCELDIIWYCEFWCHQDHPIYIRIPFIYGPCYRVLTVDHLQSHKAQCTRPVTNVLRSWDCYDNKIKWSLAWPAEYKDIACNCKRDTADSCKKCLWLQVYEFVPGTHEAGPYHDDIVDESSAVNTVPLVIKSQAVLSNYWFPPTASACIHSKVNGSWLLLPMLCYCSLSWGSSCALIRNTNPWNPICHNPASHRYSHTLSHQWSTVLRPFSVCNHVAVGLLWWLFYLKNSHWSR